MEQLQTINVTAIEARLLREFVRSPDFFRRMLLDMYERCLFNYNARKDPPQEEMTETVEAGIMETRMILEYRSTNDYGKLTIQEILLPRLHGEPPYTLNGKRLMRRSTWDMLEPDRAYEQEQAARAAASRAGEAPEDTAGQMQEPPTVATAEGTGPTYTTPAAPPPDGGHQDNAGAEHGHLMEQGRAGSQPHPEAAATATASGRRKHTRSQGAGAAAGGLLDTSQGGSGSPAPEIISQDNSLHLMAHVKPQPHTMEAQTARRAAGTAPGGRAALQPNRSQPGRQAQEGRNASG